MTPWCPSCPHCGSRLEKIETGLVPPHRRFKTYRFDWDDELQHWCWGVPKLPLKPIGFYCHTCGGLLFDGEIYYRVVHDPTERFDWPIVWHIYPSKEALMEDLL